jgi:hypothetical protein
MKLKRWFKGTINFKYAFLGGSMGYALAEIFKGMALGWLLLVMLGIFYYLDAKDNGWF